jgi:hypothetical protein
VEGRSIAIRVLLEEHGLSLTEAKPCVDELQRRTGG